MPRIILYGVLSLIWMFLAGARFSFIFTRWENKKWNIILCITNAICSITIFVATIMLIMEAMNL